MLCWNAQHLSIDKLTSVLHVLRSGGTQFDFACIQEGGLMNQTKFNELPENVREPFAFFEPVHENGVCCIVSQAWLKFLSRCETRRFWQVCLFDTGSVRVLVVHAHLPDKHRDFDLVAILAD